VEIYANSARAWRVEPDATSPKSGGRTQFEQRWPRGLGGHHCRGGANLVENRVTAVFGTVGGGVQNQSGGSYATVAGGSGNTAQGDYGAIGGGRQNSTGTYEAAVAGGRANNASGGNSAIGGGYANTASGAWSTIPGGAFNMAAGQYALAAGHRAKANHDGSFVWADGADADFASTAANQFLIRAGEACGWPPAMAPRRRFSQSRRLETPPICC